MNNNNFLTTRALHFPNQNTAHLLQHSSLIKSHETNGSAYYFTVTRGYGKCIIIVETWHLKNYFYKEKVSNNEKGFTEAEYIEINKKDEKDD